MPELPEVETSRLYVEEFCLGSTITNVHATEQGGGPVSFSRDTEFEFESKATKGPPIDEVDCCVERPSLAVGEMRMVT